MILFHNSLKACEKYVNASIKVIKIANDICLFTRNTKKLEKVESFYDVYTYHIHYLHMYISSKFGHIIGSSVRGGLDGWVGVI